MPTPCTNWNVHVAAYISEFKWGKNPRKSIFISFASHKQWPMQNISSNRPNKKFLIDLAKTSVTSRSTGKKEREKLHVCRNHGELMLRVHTFWYLKYLENAEHGKLLETF